MRGRSLIGIILLGALALPLGGCAQLTAAFKPEPKIVTQEATVAVVGAAVSGKLEADMPEGLPLWPKSTVVKSTYMRAPGGRSWAATLLTDDTYDDVLKGTGAGLQKAGWTFDVTDASVPGAKSAVLNISRQGKEGVVSIVETPEGTSIEYVINP